MYRYKSCFAHQFVNCTWIYIDIKYILYQYNEINAMHILFNLLRIKDLYMFRSLLAHPQEALHKRHFVYCVRVMSAAPELVPPRTQYTKCRLCSASWWWASNIRNMERPLILNKLNKQCITLVSLCWYYKVLTIINRTTYHVLSKELSGYTFRPLSGHLQTKAGHLLVEIYSLITLQIKRNK
jgi:hypothetical protein